MQLKRYLVLSVLAMSLMALAACGAQSTATPEPFAKYKSVDVLKALSDAGLSVESPLRSLGAGGGAPLSFNDRYTFTIVVAGGAPLNGQFMIFATPEGLQKWQDYITSQKASSDSKRNWLFVYTQKNVLLQVSPDLTNDQAERYHQVLAKLP